MEDGGSSSKALYEKPVKRGNAKQREKLNHSSLDPNSSFDLYSTQSMLLSKQWSSALPPRLYHCLTRHSDFVSAGARFIHIFIGLSVPEFASE